MNKLFVGLVLLCVGFVIIGSARAEPTQEDKEMCKVISFLSEGIQMDRQSHPDLTEEKLKEMVRAEDIIPYPIKNLTYLAVDKVFDIYGVETPPEVVRDTELLDCLLDLQEDFSKNENEIKIEA